MRKLTLSIDDVTYDGLVNVAGRGNIGRFITEAVRPHLAVANDVATGAYGILRQYAKAELPSGDELMAAKRAHMRKRLLSKSGVIASASRK